MKYTLVVIAAVLMLVGSGLAQMNYLHANIPFDFVVENVTMPAGTYQIEKTNEFGVLELVGPTKTLLLPTDGAENMNGAPESSLVFAQYGGKYYLSQIWCEGNEEGYNVPLKTKNMSVLAEKGATVQIAAAR